MERQKTYGWLVAADIFLAGAGGGTFLIAFFLGIFNMNESITKIGALSGLVLVLIGTFFLLAELGCRTRFYKLFTKPSSLMSSWISRGAWILISFIIFGLVYLLPSLWLSEWRTSGLGQAAGVVAALLSILVIIYPGFLFSVVRGIPFWNTSTLPLLFLLSSLCTGIAALLMVGIFSREALTTADFQHLGAAGIVLILMQLFVLGVYLSIAQHRGLSAAESVRLLKTPLFVGGAIIIGLLVPSGLLIYSVLSSDVPTLYILVGVSSVFLLIGALFLRSGIIRAGVYFPLR